MKQWFYYSVLRACKLYTDDHYQTATKNFLPFIRKSELCMCYKILFWPAIFQRFFPSSALGPVLRASHIAQEPTGSFPRPSSLAPCMHWIEARFLPIQKLARFYNYRLNTRFQGPVYLLPLEFTVEKKQFAIIAVTGDVDMGCMVEIDEMMRQDDISEYTVEQRRQDLVLFVKWEKLGELLIYCNFVCSEVWSCFWLKTK